MKKSKLLKVLTVFGPKELRRLAAYLKSPYFFPRGIPEDEWKLFELLKKNHPKFSEKALKKEKVFEHLYPDRSYVEGVLDRKMSFLLKRIENFILQEDVEDANHDLRRLMAMSRFYRKKNLPALYETNVAHVRKEQAQIRQKGPDDLLLDYKFQQELTEYRGLHNTLKDDLNIGNTLDALDDFYLASKLYYSFSFLFQSSFHTRIEAPHPSLLLEDTHQIQEKKNLVDLPMIRIYSIMLALVRKNKEGYFDLENFSKLEAALALHEKEIPLKLLKEIYAFCRSFYLRQLSNGNKDLLGKVFELYQEHLEKGYLFYQGGLHPVLYRNVVSFGLKLKKYDWIFQFIHQYKDQIIGTNNPQDLFHFNLADYYFRIKDYEMSKEFLGEHYSDLFYQIIAKRLEIKIYFEEQSPILESKIDAFRLFLLRLSKKKLLDATNHFQSNKHFINLLKQILHPKTFKNVERIDALMEKIKNLKIIAERAWLLEKLSQVKNSPLT